MKKKKHLRRIHPLTALCAVILTVLPLLVIGYFVFPLILQNKDSAAEVTEETAEPAADDGVVNILRQGDIAGIYEKTMELDPGMNSKTAYEDALKSLLNGVDWDAVSTEYEENNCAYRIYEGNEWILTVYEYSDDSDEKSYAIPLHGTKSYLLEVPTGMKLTINGYVISDEAIVTENTEAANFFQVSGYDFVPYVDIYELDGMLGIPDIELDGKKACLLEDPVSGHLLAGLTVDDHELEELLMEDAVKLALYPAQDIALSEVTAISLTSSDWYQKYITLQNYWFTAHDIMEVSNEEVLDIAAQSDDTVVAHVIFDYFADDGEVSRTWYIGYQLTMVNMDGEWLIAGTEINNELNSGQIQPE